MARVVFTRCVDEPAKRPAPLPDLALLFALVAGVYAFGAYAPDLVRRASGQPGVGPELLVSAAGVGDLATVRRVLDAGTPADAAPHGLTALEVANSAAVVRLLLDRGANPCGLTGDNRPLTAAVLHHNEPVARLLLQRGADPTARPRPCGLSPLETVRELDDPALLRLFFGEGPAAPASRSVLPEAAVDFEMP